VDEPHIHVRATARAHVFAPRNGMVLRGTVTEACATHLAVLAYGVFNATLPHPKTSSASSAALSSGPGRNSGHHGGSSGGAAGAWEAVAAGSAVRFRVRRMQHAEGLLAMEGALLDVLADGPDDAAATPSAAAALGRTLGPAKTHKKRGLEANAAVAAVASSAAGGEEAGAEAIAEARKKKKKHARPEDAGGPPSAASSSAVAPGASAKESSKAGGDGDEAGIDGGDGGDGGDDEKKRAKRARKKAAQSKKKGGLEQVK
jgi:hypothetical protein